MDSSSCGGAETPEKCLKKDITDTNTTAEQRRVLSEIIDKEDLVSYDIRMRSLQSNGGNYLGDLAEVDVIGETSNGNKELNLFMKTAVRGDKISIISVNGLYRREIFAYKELRELYESLQNKVGITDDEKFEFVKCHGVSDKRDEELLILENMSRKGYATVDRMKCVSEGFAERAVIALAKFHALSYAMKELKRDEFRKVTSGILSRSAINYDSDVWIQFIRNMKETVSSCVGTPEMVERLNNFVERMLDVFPGYHLPNERSVICHGDYRPNNMLFKEENGKIVDMLAVDFQLMYYGCPLNDLFYFIYVATSREYRMKNLIRLKDLYRDHMKDYLKRFDIDIENVYPLDEFDSTFEKKSEYGLMVSIQFLPIILAPEDDVPKYGDKEISEVKIKSCSVFEQRMGGVIEDYVEFGLI